MVGGCPGRLRTASPAPCDSMGHYGGRATVPAALAAVSVLARFLGTDRTGHMSLEPQLATSSSARERAANAPDVAAERRGAQRLPACDLPWITGVRVGNVDDAQMINVSSTGVLVQCQARLVPGQEAILQIVGVGNRFRIRGQVVRCGVADVRGEVRYEVAVAFDPDPCPLPVSMQFSTAWA